MATTVCCFARNMDRLYDRSYISFEVEGRMLISPLVDAAQVPPASCLNSTAVACRALQRGPDR